MASKTCHCQEPGKETKNLQGDFPNLYDTLPSKYEYHLCSYQEVDGGYTAELRVAVTREEIAQAWIEDYQKKSRVTLRVRTTKPRSGRVNLLAVYYRCQHNTLPRSSDDQTRSNKNTNCPAEVNITLKRYMGKKSRAKLRDEHLPKFALKVAIKYTHNHAVFSADSLKHHDVSKETVNIFKDLFARGHSPSSALNTHKLNLQVEFGGEYTAADRAICPDLQFCHRLYKKIYEKTYGAASGEQMLLDLDSAIKKYNKEQGMECAKMSVQDNKVIIAVCTPLMQRILTEHPNSAELVFVDSSGGMDKYNLRVFLLLTHSVAGGVPIGCLITTSETKETITSALNLYKEILPLGAFYGRGQQGPAVFMTDDSDAEQQSLKATFPGATCLLCTFHVLQTLWRYLWDSKQAIKREDRPYLLGLVKDMMYSKCEEDLQALYATLCANRVACQYKNYLGYVAKLYSRRSEWAICLHSKLPVKGNHNYFEAEMRVLKDQIFERVRAYSPVQLLDFILICMTGYYERRLTDLANGRLDVMVSKRYLPDHGKITPEMICRVSDTSQMYQVQSESNAGRTYDVDMVHGMCTCAVGLNGAACKHQYAVLKHCQVNLYNFFPFADEKMRQHLLYLASGLGNEYVPDEWLCSLGAGNSPHDDLNQHDDIDSTMNLQGSASAETTTSMTRSSAVESLCSQRHFQNMLDRRNCAGACGSTGNGVEGGRVTDADIAAVLDGVQSIADKLKDMVKLNPEEMIGPAKVFIKQFSSLKSNAAVISALQTFGKYTGAAEKLSQENRAKCLCWTMTD